MISALVPPGTDRIPISAAHAVSDRKVKGGCNLCSFLFAVDRAGIDGGADGSEFFAKLFVAV